METELKSNLLKIICMLGFILLVTFLSYLSQLIGYNDAKKNYDCYVFHVQECLNCHQQNLTYLLCSGFCVKPSLQDFDKRGCPVVNPLNDCFDLPKECNL